ncbi:NADPH:quinone oxidoreductase family protein [Bradyrhizobium diazoefficiens]|nr:NADPH:quinone oxidoreductase family protein [Bradyrhizobium diazoefficiens]MBR0963952.1 NADPH:quinone oxidoreductase family protein [Bradyrhizobium diazoefficiens]MBR0978104.1 NADPH:quinone oxidoreductase family protein [Bradyrhizobium diazoefficiens]MBR1006035.1 NADPH:quinone oxidoreductase family protein [Bradyrhizobium diazoefficiens]MBR1014087.1 NADPH:quinone oxidoreductase family protein [Bradyrhizobium diazoefficiens]MBR1050224.1 NADPH:quinone oxidoreductase family protein [Bradyrhizo
MKAVVVEQYAPIDQIELKDVSSPRIEPGQLRIKVEAAGIGFVDGLKIQGLYQTKDPLPFIPGTEFAGVVAEAPGEPAGYRPGMRVMGMTRSGALAEEIVVKPEALYPLPDGVAAEVAASFRANYLTALYALSARAAIVAGEHLLVLGAAGGTGTAAVQIGKLLGARVIAAASTPEKREFARAHGADAVIDYTQAGWRDELKELTKGHGADVIFDPVGGDISVQAFRSIAWRGRHLVVGFAGGAIPALPFNLPLLKGGALLGVDLAQIPVREPEIQQRLMARLIGWLAEGKMKPAIGRVFALQDFREAFRTMQTRAALGKMVVRIWR